MIRPSVALLSLGSAWAWRYALAGIVLLLAAVPRVSHAADTCDKWRNKEIRAFGKYQPAAEPYARRFAFGMDLDCGSGAVLVTVQRPTGNLPICNQGQSVEVQGKLVWNRALVSGHYEINNPSNVVCH